MLLLGRSVRFLVILLLLFACCSLQLLPCSAVLLRLVVGCAACPRSQVARRSCFRMEAHFLLGLLPDRVALPHFSFSFLSLVPTRVLCFGSGSRLRCTFAHLACATVVLAAAPLRPIRIFSRLLRSSFFSLSVVLFCLGLSFFFFFCPALCLEVYLPSSPLSLAPSATKSTASWVALPRFLLFLASFSSCFSSC